MSEQPMFPHKTFGLAMAAITAFTWGFLAIALKFALAFASSGTIAHFRFFAAGLFLAVYTAVYFGFMRKSRLISWSQLPWSLMILAALSLALNYFGYMHGLSLTSASNAQILIQAGPLMLLFAGLFWFGEKFQPHQFLFVGLAMFGFLLFYNFQSDQVDVFQWKFIEGNGWVVIGAVAWAAYTIFQKFLNQKVDILFLNLFTFLVCAVCLLPVVQFSEWQRWDALQWLVMFALGVNTVIAYGCLNLALKYAPASQVSVIITCNPILTLTIMNVLAMFEVTWIEAEPLPWLGWLGAGLVVLGVIGAQTRTSTRPSNK